MAAGRNDLQVLTLLLPLKPLLAREELCSALHTISESAPISNRVGPPPNKKPGSF